jgi:hypothetical protein
MKNFVQPQQMNNWKDDLKRIKTAREKLNRDQGMMTPWERQTHGESLRDEIHKAYPRVYKGLKADLDDLIHKYNDAKTNTSKAKAREINSWDMGKLEIEIRVFQSMVKSALENAGDPLTGVAGPSQQIEKLYEEAIASQNPVKIRAAADVLNGLSLTKLPSDEAVAIRMTARDAAIVRDTIRKTDYIQAAEKAESEAAFALIQARDQVHEAAEILGEPSSNIFAVGGIGKLAKTIQVGNDGTLNIFDLDDPQVTGIDLSNVNWNQVDSDQEGIA